MRSNRHHTRYTRRTPIHKDSRSYRRSVRSAKFNIIRSAQGLAAQGFQVFPVWEITAEHCACGKGTECSSPGKHPRIADGHNAATSDLSRIDSWWTRWPEANIGLRTGDGLVVVDIDGPLGKESAAALDLPETVEATTGRGRHLYYRGQSGCRTGIRPGIDLRGEGGYVIAPPSQHASGTQYAWVRDPATHEIADLPAWALTRDSQSRAAGGPLQSPSQVDHQEVLHEGERNDGLFRFACRMRSTGISEGELAAVIAQRNADCCQPPLDESEVRRIAQSAARNPGVYLPDAELLALALNPHTLVAYLAIRSRADDKGVSIISQEAIAESGYIGVSRVKTKAIKELEDCELVQVKRPPPLHLRTDQRPLANEYTLTRPPADGPTPTEKEN